MKRSSRRVAGVGMVVGAVSGVILMAGPANAAGLTTSFGCIAQGAGAMECFATTTGGVPPYTYHWNVSHGTGPEISFSCGSKPTTVTVTESVTDTAGNSGTQTRSFYCPGGPPH
jgi:hypothetical protein